MTIALYRAPGIGTGTAADPYRSKIAQYVDGSGGSDFEDWILDPEPRGRYCLVQCDPTVHTTIAADAAILAMSPQAATLNAAEAWLDGPIGTVSVALRNAIEGDGIPIDDFTVSTTRRVVWRRIAMRCRVGQFMQGTNDTNALAFLVANLATTVGSLSAAVRNRGSAWITGQGLDASWIVGTTTVREVIRYILINVALNPLQWGRMAL